MNIIAAPPCPSWCRAEIPTSDDGRMHISGEQVLATADGSQIYVSLERADAGDTAGLALIRVEGGGELTPLGAFQLANFLQAAAIAGLTGGAR